MGRVSWSVVLILVVGAFVVQAVEEKTKPKEPPKAAADKTNAGPSKTQGFGEIMDTIDYVRSGAMVVGFLAVSFAGRDTWMLAEFISAFAFGIAAYFFPDALLSYETEGSLDVGHLVLSQAFGAILLGLAVTVYVSRESRDRSVAGSILLSRVLGGAVFLQAMVIDHLKTQGDKQKWNQAHMSFGVLGCALWVVGSLWQYLRSPSYGSGGIDLSQRLTKHLLIDLLIVMPIGLAQFAFPDFFLTTVALKGFKADGIHAHLIRACGALMFMSGLHGHSAMGFSDDIDKRAHLLGRAVTMLLYLPLQVLYQYKYNLTVMNMFYFNVGLTLFVLLNPLCAYFIRSKAKRN